MDVGFYAAKIQTQVMRHRDDIEYNYERFPDATRFWAMIDLVASSNYRLSHGPGKGYIRGETFFSLVKEVIAPQVNIELLKEIGDAVLLSADSLRPLLESLLLVDLVASQMATLDSDKRFPFAIHGGISFGPAKKLHRSKPDYLGTPLDQLARVLGLKDTEGNLFLLETAYREQERIVAEYDAFLSLSASKMLSSKDSKNMIEPVRYRELRVDQGALREFRKCFVPWREQR